MMLLDKTSEKLRSKHVRTLELLQKTLDENGDLRARIAELQKGTLHLGQGVPRSNLTAELEDEIDRLKTEHIAQLAELEKSHTTQQTNLTQSLETTYKQQQKLQNDLQTAEIALFNAREALQQERARWIEEREGMLAENKALQKEIERLRDQVGNQAYEVQLQNVRHELEQNKLSHRKTIEELIREVTQLQADLESHAKATEMHKMQVDTLQNQVESEQDKRNALTQELAILRDRNIDLQIKLAQPKVQVVPAITQQLHASTLQKLQIQEDQVAQLTAANHEFLQTIAVLQNQVSELTKKATHQSSVFSVHVDLKRENLQLRAQVEELKQLQKRFLTTARKKTMSFPAL